MKNRIIGILFGILSLSCTAYVDQPRTTVRQDRSKTDIVFSYKLPALATVSSISSDRLGNACFTQSEGWIMSSVGWNGDELFRSDMQNPRNTLLSGNGDYILLLNDLDRTIQCLDRNGKQISIINYSGISATTGTATPTGEIYLLDGITCQIKVLDISGNPLRDFHADFSGVQGFRPVSIAVDATRNVLVLADPAKGLVVYYNIYGAKQSSSNIRVGRHPQAIGFDYMGRLWICQPERGIVEILGLEGDIWTLKLAVPLARPYAVALSPLGSGIIAEEGNLAFIKF